MVIEVVEMVGMGGGVSVLETDVGGEFEKGEGVEEGGRRWR